MADKVSQSTPTGLWRAQEDGLAAGDGVADAYLAGPTAQVDPGAADFTLGRGPASPFNGLPAAYRRVAIKTGVSAVEMRAGWSTPDVVRLRESGAVPASDFYPRESGSGALIWGLESDAVVLKGKMIGEGSTGRVHQAVDLNGKGWAVKQLFLDGFRDPSTGVEFVPTTADEVLLEVEFMKKAGFEARLYVDPTTRQSFIVTELGLGSIESILEAHQATLDAAPEGITDIAEIFSIRLRAFFALAHLAEVRRCHAKGIAQRDVKPANALLMPNAQVRLCDFGFATATTDETTTSAAAMRRTLLGTPVYLAPELMGGMLGQGHRAYDPKVVDRWSLAVSVAVTLTGNALFEGLEEGELHELYGALGGCVKTEADFERKARAFRAVRETVFKDLDQVYARAKALGVSFADVRPFIKNALSGLEAVRQKTIIPELPVPPKEAVWPKLMLMRKTAVEWANIEQQDLDALRRMIAG